MKARCPKCNKLTTGLPLRIFLGGKTLRTAAEEEIESYINRTRNS